jgi:hypothetical protein
MRAVLLVLALWLAAAAALALAVPAVASSPAGAYRYPGQRPAADPLLDELRNRAGAFWDRAGQFGCLPDVDLAADLGEREPPEDGQAPARGWTPRDHGECRIALRADYVGPLLGRARRPFRRVPRRVARDLRRGALYQGAYVVFHEVGHARGLGHPHTDPPTMWEAAWQLAGELTRRRPHKGCQR